MTFTPVTYWGWVDVTGRELSALGHTFECIPDRLMLHAKLSRQVPDRDDDAAAQSNASDLAAAHELVCRGSADAEDGSCLFDGDREWMIVSHTYVGPPSASDFASGDPPERVQAPSS